MTDEITPFYPLAGIDPASIEDIEAHSTGLNQEIDLLRCYIRRVTLRQNEASGPVESAGILRTLSISVLSLSQLVRTQYYISSSEETARSLKEAIHRIALELRAVE